MRRRALVFLLGSLALSACVTAGPQGSAVNGNSASAGRGGAPEQLSPAANPSPARRRPVAILLPLSGPLAERGQAMLRAAQLALDQPGALALDARDTGGTPDGAGTAAQQAIAAGDGIIVGPLTAGETAVVAGPARVAGLPVLAFTSDPAQARPGVWTLGLTPGQQVRRLVTSAQAAGVHRFAALLPDNDFGRLMGEALTEAVTAAGDTAPTIRRYGAGTQSLTAAVRDVADYANRRGPIDEQLKAAKSRDDADSRSLAEDLSHQTPPPPPFDALLLADPGSRLGEIGSLLTKNDVEAPPVRILGPALWAAPATRVGSAASLGNAFYAAPDPAARKAFEAAYAAKYGSPPGPLTDLAYDATSLARVVLEQGGDLLPSLSRAEGFTGADGVLVLAPDGRVQRGLAVFQLQRGTSSLVDPAPQTLTAPPAPPAAPKS